MARLYPAATNKELPVKGPLGRAAPPYLGQLEFFFAAAAARSSVIPGNAGGDRGSDNGSGSDSGSSTVPHKRRRGCHYAGAPPSLPVGGSGGGDEKGAKGARTESQRRPPCDEGEKHVS